VRKQIIRTRTAPSSPLYSQGVRAGSTIHLSGTTGLDTATGQLAGPTIQQQTRRALHNCRAILEAGGGTLDDVVQVTVLLADPTDFTGMNEAYAEVFTTDPPTRAVARLGPELPGLLVSITMIAHVHDSPSSAR
jgi:2-iminobutanoate/2-iminopropanoate deaminase